MLKKEDKRLTIKLWEIVLDTMEHPKSGLGKPEELKGDLSGWWSKQINDRLIYQVVSQKRMTENEGTLGISILEIVSCYGHYGDK